MGQFNTRLVESLDFLNKVLAVIFSLMAMVRFFELAGDNFLGALFESLTVVGVGVLTCGYIALMLNINNLLQDIRDKGNKND